MYVLNNCRSLIRFKLEIISSNFLFKSYQKLATLEFKFSSKNKSNSVKKKEIQL